jgi:hypothetical protein
MTRASRGRATVSAAAAAIFLIAGPTVAMAGTRSAPFLTRERSRLLRSIGGSRLPTLAPSSAGDAGGRERCVSIFVKVPGPSPYQRLQISAVEGSDGARIDVSTFRFDPATNGNQFFYWSFREPRGSVMIANDLSRISIHTGATLGSFGTIDLELASAGPLSKHAARCRSTGVRLNTRLTRRVRMSGVVDLTLGIATIPEPLRTTAGRGIALRTTFTGSTCPKERRCYPYAGFGARDGGDEVSVLFDRQGMVDIIRERESWRMRSIAWFSRYPYDLQPVSITHDTATLDGALASPFLTGGLRFDRAGPAQGRRRGPCRFIHAPFSWTSGTLDVLWDSGAQSLVGPWKAQLYRWRRPGSAGAAI